MDSNVEKDCTLLEDLFQQVVIDMKNSFPAWEDFILKSGRLHSALKTVAVCMTSFLEAFQRVADMATGTRGSTREIGSALTRLCLRHRSIENKLKGLNNALTDAMIIPLQERMEEWKRSVVSLDRDHTKESKKVHQDLKRASLEAVRQQKKLKKGKIEASEQLDRAVQDVNDKLLLLREFEKASVKASLIEERSRLCLFISCLKPVMDEEMAMLTEVTHLQEIVHSLCMVADDPESLSSSSEQVVSDLIGIKSQPSLSSSTVVPGSPSSEGSLTSSAGSLSHSPTHHSAYNRSQSQPNPATGTLPFSLPKDVTSSVSSQDSMVAPSYSSVSASDAFVLNTSGDHFKLAETGGTAAAYESGQRQMRGAKLMRAKDSTYLTPFERPHTISTAYERSASRPVLTSETYMAPELCHHSQLPPSHQHRPQSTYIGSTSSSTANDNPYAVPCLVPKRRQVQSGEVKVADIYARPSLVSGTGYRTPNIRPLPVATPTVPDFGTGQAPAFPVAGYVNMNQLAHMALQHQQELSQKKEQQESSDEKTDDDEVALKYSGSVSAEQRKSARGLRPYASAEGDADAEADQHRPSYGTWGSSHAKEPALAPARNSMEPSLTLPGSGIDLHALADRLSRACHLESIDNFCTLRYRKPPSGHYLSSSTAGISALYSGKSLGREPITSRVASMPRGFSLTDMPPVAASPLQLYASETGSESRPSRYTQGKDCWSPDQEPPVMK